MNYTQMRNRERKHIESTFVNDKRYKKTVEGIYKTAQDNVEKEINNLLTKYAGEEQLSMDVARRRISTFDVVEHQKKVAQYVDDNQLGGIAEQIINNYNVTTRTNYLQLLLEDIRLETVNLADKEVNLLTSRLDSEIRDEMIRQSGIFQVIQPTPQELRNAVSTIVNADYHNVHFSDRIWRDQKILQNELDNTISRVLIQGKNPREGVKDLMKAIDGDFVNKRRAAERIAITESARVQTAAQEKAFEDIGVDMVEWVAEPGTKTCDICEGMNGKQFKRVEMFEQDYSIPAHPYCRCSYAGVIDRENWEQRMRARGL